ncbi:hypothetical protein Hypma_014410 [Hypsizygus marmoreus]|uniref:F-box domain-containing protein n=1 Tax=Hypsizygus marmoreus TaxID=39966 RepID=A0A369JCB7_HYPMA|nr:hypothetical protein Hypma_014410 [Hypsizygus marmoreus]
MCQESTVIGSVATTTLPPEIVDSIIDQLHDEPVSLKNCSLVSKTFVSRTQKHLYTSIRLVFSLFAKRHAAQGLLDIFINKPGLARHVQNLYIENYLEGIWDEQAECCRGTDEILPHFFSCIRSLQLFSLKGRSLSRMYPYTKFPTNLSPYLASALLQMFRSNKVTEIAIMHINNFPIGHIAFTCPYLKRLSLESLDLYRPLEDAMISGADLPAPPVVSTKGCLEVLRLGPGCGPAAQELHEYAASSLSRLSLTDLQIIILRGNDVAVRVAAAAIITDSASSLEHFDWDHRNYDCRFPLFIPAPLTLGVTMKLRVMRLACIHYPTCEPMHLLWVSATLREIRGNNNIEELVLVLTCHIRHAIAVEWGECKDWASSFDTLMTSAGFDNLRKVTFCFEHPNVNENDPLPMDSFVLAKELLENRLPLLKCRGLLSFRWDDGED